MGIKAFFPALNRIEKWVSRRSLTLTSSRRLRSSSTLCRSSLRLRGGSATTSKTLGRRITMKQDLYQDDKFMINVGLQVTITALYLYQSALFPRLYQSVMKASKSTAKPVLRAKSPA